MYVIDDTNEEKKYKKNTEQDELFDLSAIKPHFQESEKHNVTIDKQYKLRSKCVMLWVNVGFLIYLSPIEYYIESQIITINNEWDIWVF